MVGGFKIRIKNLATTTLLLWNKLKLSFVFFEKNFIKWKNLKKY